MNRKQKQSQDDGSFDKVVSVRRVTKVTKGGKRFAFSAFVISGDQEGSIGVALGKSREVSSAISKATAKAKKSRFKVALRGSTLPYAVTGSHGASKVIIKAASKGTGVIAGGAMRAVLESVGITDVLAKSNGSSNPHNVVKATMDALGQMRDAVQVAHDRGVSMDKVFNG